MAWYWLAAEHLGTWNYDRKSVVRFLFGQYLWKTSRDKNKFKTSFDHRTGLGTDWYRLVHARAYIQI